MSTPVSPATSPSPAPSWSGADSSRTPSPPLPNEEAVRPVVVAPVGFRPVFDGEHVEEEVKVPSRPASPATPEPLVDQRIPAENWAVLMAMANIQRGQRALREAGGAVDAFHALQQHIRDAELDGADHPVAVAAAAQPAPADAGDADADGEVAALAALNHARLAARDDDASPPPPAAPHPSHDNSRAPSPHAEGDGQLLMN